MYLVQANIKEDKYPCKTVAFVMVDKLDYDTIRDKVNERKPAAKVFDFHVIKKVPVKTFLQHKGGKENE